MVGTWRTEEQGPALLRLLPSPATDRVLLDRLPEPALRRIAAGMLGQREDTGGEAGALVARAEGNPLFLPEFLHAAAELGLLRRSAPLGWRLPQGAVLDALPSTVDGLVRQRLADLGDNSLAAILGRKPPPEVAARVAEVGEFELLAAANLVARRGRLTQAREGYQAALAEFQALGELRFEPHTRYALADLDRREGLFDQAEAGLDAAESGFAAQEATASVGIVRGRRGHLAPARGEPAEPFLDEARAIASQCGAGDDRPLGEAIGLLRRALDDPAACVNGEPSPEPAGSQAG